MKNQGLFSTLFIEDVRAKVALDDAARGRMATLQHTWSTRNGQDTEALWNSFLKQALGYLKFVLPATPSAPGVYPLYDDYSYATPIAVLYLCPPGADLDDVAIGRFWPGKLVANLRRHRLNWGILTDGAKWRLYSLKTAKPYEDFVELDLAGALAKGDEPEYALFEKFFHRDSFVNDECGMMKDEGGEPTGRTDIMPAKCRLDHDRVASEELLERLVKKPLLDQVDEVLQYLCNGFIADTPRKGEEYTEEERRQIFESAVKLLYRCLFLFYAEARSLLPSDPEKRETYKRLSIMRLCEEARKFQWQQRKDTDAFDLWKHLKGLVNAVNDGDPEYGIMGYNGGLFDDEEEKFLRRHKLRNDFLARALYLLAYVEPLGKDPDDEYPIPYADLEVRHLGELYENILEFNVTLADADRLRRRTRKGVQILLASGNTFDPKTDSRIRKGDVFFGETALERKQTGSYYTPETLVHFLNQKAIVNPLRECFDKEYRPRFAVFCKEALSGRDLPTRRGAAQSAVALVEQFVEEVVLKFRACDPAMGSGHFLVNAGNQITDLIVELLSELPHVEGMRSRVSCTPNHWRRLVTRHCLYGVDLNPLAVHLAKLSLWLNCFAREHKLTFLDHHLKDGNSLIGIRSLRQLEKLPERPKTKKRKNEQGLLFPTDLKKACARLVAEIEKINRVAEDDTDRMKALHEEAVGETRAIRPLADLHTAYLIDHSTGEEDYREIFSDLAKGRKPSGILSQDILSKVAMLTHRHRFFHWSLEFPEVFSADTGGFDATVGNPPWDMSSANPKDFFPTLDDSFRALSRIDSLKEMERLCEEHPAIGQRWNDYQAYYDAQNRYLNTPSVYPYAPTGRNNLFHYLLHRGFDILAEKGRLGLVVPSGLYTDRGCRPLREMFLTQSTIQCLYCYENRWPAVFSAVHNMFKFILFCTQKGGDTKSFKAGFMLHDPEILPAVDNDALEMPVEMIKKFSPDDLSITELNTQREIDILGDIFSAAPLLGSTETEAWNVRFNIEFMSNTDAWRFAPRDTHSVPVWAGRCFFQFDEGFASPDRSVAEEHMDSLYDSGTPLWKDYRLVFRDIAASTNERTCISMVIPPPSACVETARLIYVDSPDAHDNKALTLFLAALLNSYCLDFVIRHMVTSHLSQHIMSRLPVLRSQPTERMPQSIISRAARLVCTSSSYAALWRDVFHPHWASRSFWYPSGRPTAYGPSHEHLLRKRLADEAATLTPEWTPQCGVHDRLPDRRDTGDRAQLRAEIDAYVAHLYGLSRDDFEYIFSTFPVLERKENQAFGEFQSKRKCLEEYDRIAGVLGG